MDIDKELIEKVTNGDIFELLGLTDAPADQKEKLLEQMAETVMARTLKKVFEENFSEEEKAGFSTMDMDQMLAALNNKGVDFEGLLANESIKHRLELVAAYHEINSVL